MPLHSLLTFGPDCQAALWHIAEDEPTLRSALTLTPDEAADLATIAHPTQRVEWLACRVALRSLVEKQGILFVGTEKDGFGKPHLIGDAGFISVSHTEGWAAATFHRTRPVGLDIEPIREQLARVVPRVLSSAENAHAAGQLARLATYWCAKEAMYKRYGKRGLTFRDHLQIEPFQDGAATLTAHVRLPDYVEALEIHIRNVAPGLLAVAF